MNRKKYEIFISERLKDLNEDNLKHMLDYLNYLIVKDVRKELNKHE